jgi:hypothetical protein
MKQHSTRRFLIVVISLCPGFLWSGQALAQGDEIEPTPTIIEIPEEPGEVSVAIGETMVAKARIYTYRGIELQKAVEARQRGGSGAGRPSVIIQPQYLVARSEDSLWVYYTGNVIYKQGGVTDMTGELGTGGLQNRVGGFRFSKEDPTDIEIWVRQHRGRGFYIEEPLEYREATIGGGGEHNEAEELVFGGLKDNEMQFIYRKHVGTSPEPAVEETISVSRDSGPAVSVKGASVEILDTTADSVKFRMLANFE